MATFSISFLKPFSESLYVNSFHLISESLDVHMIHFMSENFLTES